MLAVGLFATDRWWSPLQKAQMWLQQAAHVLTNDAGANAATVAKTYRALLEEVLKAQGDAAVAAWATHFSSVTMRYWRGLFHCYDVRDLPPDEQ